MAKYLLSTSRSLEQVSKTKLSMMAAIEDSPEKNFNWLKFIIDSIVKQTSKLSYNGIAFTKKGRILFGTKICYIIDNCDSEKQFILSSNPFPRNRIIFRRNIRGKREKQSEISAAEEGMEVEEGN